MLAGDSLSQREHEADDDSHHDDQKSERHDAGRAYCRNDPVDEHDDESRSRRESDDRSQNEVEESDVRGAGDDVDDGEWCDRNDAHEYHRNQSSAGEAHGQLVQTLSSETSQSVAAQFS